MSLGSAVNVFAGFMVLFTLALGYFVSPYWFLFTAFVGFNLIQSAFTGFCPAANVLKMLGFKPGAAF